MTDDLAARLRFVRPGDYGRALDINHAFKIRQLKGRRLFTDKPPDFRAQLLAGHKEHPTITDFFNQPKGSPE